MHFTDIKTLKRMITASCCICVAVVIAFVIFRAFYYRHVDVVIDPGHGGDDYGAVFNGRNEKDDNLALAFLVEEKLKEKGIICKLTRDNDVFISLKKRCIIANEREAKLFVALHRNSAENAQGVEIWINSESPPEDKKLAENIIYELNKTPLSLNRGVKSGYAGDENKNYYVNAHTEMPSCLVEMGFITSEADNKLYDGHLNDYAAAIANGIEKSLTEYN